MSSKNRRAAPPAVCRDDPQVSEPER